MRWAVIPEGEYRTRSGFLLMPLCLNNEWRWLERAVWREVMDGGDWSPFAWVDEPKAIAPQDDTPPAARRGEE